MRIAVLSDVHSNFEALASVFADMTTLSVDKVFCVGDLAGYGPEPERVVNFLREKRVICTLGNHDAALFDLGEFVSLNDEAAKSIVLTKKLLSKQNRGFLKGLPIAVCFDGMRFVHGCPPKSIGTYVSLLSDLELAAIFGGFTENIAFVGHTHDLGLYSFIDGGFVLRKHLVKGVKKKLDEDCRHIVNVGSVGQPRDGNNNAKYVVFDTVKREVEARFVKYDIKKTADLIKTRGFPVKNAKRLW